MNDSVADAVRQCINTNVELTAVEKNAAKLAVAAMTKHARKVLLIETGLYLVLNGEGNDETDHDQFNRIYVAALATLLHSMQSLRRKANESTIPKS